MITIKTIKRFFDKEDKVTREMDSVFTASAERAKFLIGLGFVQEFKAESNQEDPKKEPDHQEEEPEKPIKKETRKPQKKTPED